MIQAGLHATVRPSRGTEQESSTGAKEAASAVMGPQAKESQGLPAASRTSRRQKDPPLKPAQAAQPRHTLMSHFRPPELGGNKSLIETKRK